MELLVVMVILGILVGIVGGSYVTSRLKGRDAKRKSDLSQIARSLEFYFNDHEAYPDDQGGTGLDTGSIYGCGGAGTAICSWGSEFNDENETIYMGKLPDDPSSGWEYYYKSSDNGLMYWLYANLENENDISLNFNASSELQSFQNTECDFGTGTNMCNYGISSSNTTPEADVAVGGGGPLTPP